MTNEEKILEILGVMQGDMAEMKGDLKGLHAEMREVKGDLKDLHVQVDRVEADLKGLHAQVDRIETDLKGLHAEMREVKDDLRGLHDQVDRIETDLTRVKGHLEVEVERRLDALGEGHELLLQTLAHNDRVEEVEGDVSMLRAVVKEHSRQIAALKRAL